MISVVSRFTFILFPEILDNSVGIMGLDFRKDFSSESFGERTHMLGGSSYELELELELDS